MIIPKMMPEQEPYTNEELKTLYRLVEDAADKDPGEAFEETEPEANKQ